MDNLEGYEEDLFENYVRDSEKWFSGVVDLVETTYSKVESIDRMVERSKASDTRKTESKAVLVGMATVWSEFEERLSDLRKMEYHMKSNERLMRDKIETLKDENHKLMSMVIQLKKVLESKNKSDNLEDKLDRLLGLFEDNLKTLALGEYMRTTEYKSRDRHGYKSPRYIQEVDNADLARRYIEAGCVLNREIVGHFNETSCISYNGLMERLKTMGVWKYKNKNRRTL